MKKFCKKFYERICDWWFGNGNVLMWFIVLIPITLLVAAIITEIVTRFSYDEKYFVCDGVVFKYEQISSYKENYIRLNVVTDGNMRIYEERFCKSFKVVYRNNVDKGEDVMKKEAQFCNTKDMAIGLEC